MSCANHMCTEQVSCGHIAKNICIQHYVHKKQMQKLVCTKHICTAFSTLSIRLEVLGQNVDGGYNSDTTIMTQTMTMNMTLPMTMNMTSTMTTNNDLDLEND